MYKEWIEEVKVSDEEYEKMQKENELLLKSIEQQNSIIDEIKDDEKVKKYIDAFTKKTNLEEEKEELEEELILQRMLHCDHYYVRNYVDSFFDGHRTDKTDVLTCIHCGLTNRYYESGVLNDTFPYKQMSYIINSGGMLYPHFHGDYKESEVDEVKEIYDKFKEEYPEASDYDCEKHIKMVMKLRKKKK